MSNNWKKILSGAAIVILAAVFGLGGCLLSLRSHRDVVPLSLVVIGLAVNSMGRFAGPRLFGPFLSQTLIIAGPMVMAYGLWRDRQLCKCANPAHSH